MKRYCTCTCSELDPINAGTPMIHYSTGFWICPKCQSIVDEETQLELRLCPFCGRKDHLGFFNGHGLDHERVSYVFCGFCLAKGPGGINRHDAVLGWNMRVKK